MSSTLYRLGRWAYRSRRLVLAVWLAVLVLAGAGAAFFYQGTDDTFRLPGTESGAALRSFLEPLGIPALAASIDPANLLQVGIDPVVTVRELGERVAHAYANDATGTNRIAAPNPRGFGFPPGALDWEEYLGALEEIGYHDFLTVWPPQGRAPAAYFTAIVERLKCL